MSGSFYRGTTAEQDGRFSNKEKKLIRSLQWPEEFNARVDIKKVNLKVLEPWIKRKLSELAGVEDELVSNLVISELETVDEKGPDPKRLHINLEGFLDTATMDFVLELWKLLLKAQNSPGGVPETVVEERVSETDMKMRETEMEIQRVREQMLKIVGKGGTDGGGKENGEAGKGGKRGGFLEDHRPRREASERDRFEKPSRSNHDGERRHRDRSRDNDRESSRKDRDSRKEKKSKSKSRKEKDRHRSRDSSSEDLKAKKKKNKDDKKKKDKKKKHRKRSESIERSESSSLSSE